MEIDNTLTHYLIILFEIFDLLHDFAENLGAVLGRVAIFDEANGGADKKLD